MIRPACVTVLSLILLTSLPNYTEGVQRQAGTQMTHNDDSNSNSIMGFLSMEPEALSPYIMHDGLGEDPLKEVADHLNQLYMTADTQQDVSLLEVRNNTHLNRESFPLSVFLP